MGYVDKKIALQYLANSERLFDKIKTSFLNSYQNAEEDIKKLLDERNIEELHRYVHSIKGISLNIGSMTLYDDSSALVEKLKKEEINLHLIDNFIETLNYVLLELKQL